LNEKNWSELDGLLEMIARRTVRTESVLSPSQSSAASSSPARGVEDSGFYDPFDQAISEPFSEDEKKEEGEGSEEEQNDSMEEEEGEGEDEDEDEDEDEATTKKL
jgi:chromatin remodeling complex protein RSC6